MDNADNPALQRVTDRLLSDDLFEWQREPTVVGTVPPSRRLALTFTDVVDSTKLLFDLGDEEWLGIQENHFDRAKALIEENRGRLIDTAGDGVFAAFQKGTDAFLYAIALWENSGDTRIRIRAGLHCGPVLTRKDQGLCGQAVNYASRVMSFGKGSEILLSNEAIDSISQWYFDSRYYWGTSYFEKLSDCTFRNVPDTWTLWRLAIFHDEDKVLYISADASSQQLMEEYRSLENVRHALWKQRENYARDDLESRHASINRSLDELSLRLQSRFREVSPHIRFSN